ncbi:DUF6711 family protein [Lacticaseibacillus saniviri]|nr:DUF6711 family protein [Lacticaseibacillus saniviri]
MAAIAINGIAVKAPKTFSAAIQDIDGATSRDAHGNMHRDRITVKRKLAIAWGPLSNAESAQILQATSAQFFSVSYPDPMTGGQRTGTFYAGDRTAPTYSWNEKFKDIMWSGLSFDLIEK